jgi:hypothetical protein
MTMNQRCRDWTPANSPWSFLGAWLYPVLGLALMLGGVGELMEWIW